MVHPSPVANNFNSTIHIKNSTHQMEQRGLAGTVELEFLVTEGSGPKHVPVFRGTKGLYWRF